MASTSAFPARWLARWTEYWCIPPRQRDTGATKQIFMLWLLIKEQATGVEPGVHYFVHEPGRAKTLLAQFSGPRVRRGSLGVRWTLPVLCTGMRLIVGLTVVREVLKRYARDSRE